MKFNFSQLCITGLVLSLFAFSFISILLVSDLEIVKSLGIPRLADTDSKNWTFTDSVNYTYDPDVITVSSGEAKLNSMFPLDNMTFYANYNSDINGTWGLGDLTGTPTGGADVSSGVLDLAHDDNRYLDYDADQNADSQQKGCVRFNVVPSYSGTPSALRYFFAISKAHSDMKNCINIHHRTLSGNIVIYIYDSTGSTIINNVYLGVWSPTSGQSYEFEFNWDITNGETRVFIDGTQHGSTQTDTGTRDGNIGLLRIGVSVSASQDSYFKIDNFTYFNDVQHTSNYSPEPIPENDYDTNNPTIVPTEEFPYVGNLTCFNETATKPEGTDVKYHCSIDNGSTWLYWNGTGWDTTDESYDQSNNATVINANIGTIGENGTFLFRALLSSEGDNTPTLDDIVVGSSYTPPEEPPEEPPDDDNDDNGDTPPDDSGNGDDNGTPDEEPPEEPEPESEINWYYVFFIVPVVYFSLAILFFVIYDRIEKFVKR